MWFLDFDSGSTEPIHTTTYIPGMDGELDHGITYGPRIMSARFLVQTSDFYNIALIKTEIERIFDTKKPFHIIDEDNPGRRWKNVRRSSGITYTKKGPNSLIASIPLVTYTTYAESRGNSLEGFTFESELWQFGDNIPLEEMGYVHTTRQFSIWNIGDKQIDPNNMDLEVVYKGASNGLTIENLTNGSKWVYNGTSTSSDTIRLDGVFSYKNTTSIYGSTNWNVITLEPGENRIRISGTSGTFEISFKFRFHYL